MRISCLTTTCPHTRSSPHAWERLSWRNPSRISISRPLDTPVWHNSLQSKKTFVKLSKSKENKLLNETRLSGTYPPRSGIAKRPHGKFLKPSNGPDNRTKLRRTRSISKRMRQHTTLLHRSRITYQIWNLMWRCEAQLPRQKVKKHLELRGQQYH